MDTDTMSITAPRLGAGGLKERDSFESNRGGYLLYQSYVGKKEHVDFKRKW